LKKEKERLARKSPPKDKKKKKTPVPFVVDQKTCPPVDHDPPCLENQYQKRL